MIFATRCLRSRGPIGPGLAALLSLFASSAAPPERPSRSDPSGPKVTLTLESASARPSGGGLLFECRVAAENRTGKALGVRTNFTSAFDGMALVVSDEAGHVLKTQSYLYHQSPGSARKREYPLPAGTTRETLVFPVRGLPEGRVTYRVRVIGTLPGSGYDSELSTPARELRVNGKPPESVP